jgi:hypothetical protein
MTIKILPSAKNKSTDWGAGTSFELRLAETIQHQYDSDCAQPNQDYCDSGDNKEDIDTNKSTWEFLSGIAGKTPPPSKPFLRAATFGR